MNSEKLWLRVQDVCKIKLVEIAAQMEEELKRPYPSQEAIGS